MPEKHDKPDEPAYSGGEDENAHSHKANSEKTPEPPVDESDSGPATAPDDIGE